MKKLRPEAFLEFKCWHPLSNQISLPIEQDVSCGVTHPRSWEQGTGGKAPCGPQGRGWCELLDNCACLTLLVRLKVEMGLSSSPSPYGLSQL